MQQMSQLQANAQHRAINSHHMLADKCRYLNASALHQPNNCPQLPYSTAISSLEEPGGQGAHASAQWLPGCRVLESFQSVSRRGALHQRACIANSMTMTVELVPEMWGRFQRMAYTHNITPHLSAKGIQFVSLEGSCRSAIGHVNESTKKWSSFIRGEDESLMSYGPQVIARNDSFLMDGTQHFRPVRMCSDLDEQPESCEGLSASLQTQVGCIRGF